MAQVNPDEVRRDASASDWILPRLGEFGTVGGLVPAGYERYVLIDHTPPGSPEGLYQVGSWLLQPLADILAAATATPERAWFAIWDGYGVGDLQTDLQVLPHFELLSRVYHLLTAPVADAGGLNFPSLEHPWPPDLWWPDDRQWFAATDTDLGWTYLGGSVAAVSAVESLLPDRTTVVTRDRWNGEFYADRGWP